jgi:hypothetical protein
MGESWQNVYYLADKGRNMAASLLDVPLSRIPKVSIGMKTNHALIVSDVLDQLSLHGEVEVDLGGVIADAVCQLENGFLCIEVDRNNEPLAIKAKKYAELMRKEPLRLLAVTHRPSAWEMASKGLSQPVMVVTFDQMKEAQTLEWLRKELA